MKTIEPEEIIINQGDKGDMLYFVAEGTVEVRVKDDTDTDVAQKEI